MRGLAVLVLVLVAYGILRVISELRILQAWELRELGRGLGGCSSLAIHQPRPVGIARDSLSSFGALVMGGYLTREIMAGCG